MGSFLCFLIQNIHQNEKKSNFSVDFLLEMDIID